MEAPWIRVYLAGEVMVEARGRLLRERDLPSRQGRLAFVYLALRAGQAVPRDELAAALWDDALPRSWEDALSALVSKLRQALAAVGLDRSTVLPSAFGCYELRLPSGAWVDVAEAHRAVHLAEGALRHDDASGAYGDALIASIATGRPFLQGEAAAWVEAARRELVADRVRALACMVRCLAANGETELAERRGEELIALDPYREAGYMALMQVHAGAGNRAAALRVYERCCSTLREELGVTPSSALRDLHSQLLAESASATP